MKQIITKEQLDELSDLAYEKYLDWMIDKNYNQGFGRDHIVPMNVGQLIEFLVDNKVWYRSTKRNFFPIDMCDKLWEEVKDILEGVSKNAKSN